MKKETKQRIVEALLSVDRAKYPNLKEHQRVQPKVSEKSANALTQAVIKFLQAEGWQAERISTTGRYIQGKVVENVLGGKQQLPGKWIKGSGTRGSADISATIKGRSVKIEIKYGRDRQSEDQKKYQEAIEQAGGQYWIVRDLDGLLDMYDNFLEGLV